MSQAAPIQIPELRATLEQLRNDALSVRDFCGLARRPKPWLGQLPEAYAEVWDNLLDRLESAALFSGDSCSFSQSSLLDSFAMWLDKAEQKSAPSP